MQYRIIVTSSKGGVGKSTTAAYLALSLSERGKRVLVCDLDLGSRCLDMFYGVENSTVYDFGDVYCGKVDARRAIIKCASGVNFCASSLSLKADEVFTSRLCDTVSALSDAAQADYVICDTSGTTIPSRLAKWANLGLVCTTQQPASVRGAETTAQLLRESGLSSMRLVITSFEYREAKKQTRSGLLEMIDRSTVRAIGAVPYDRELFLAQESGKTAERGTPARQAYDNIAARLCGEERKLFASIRGYKGKNAL